MRDIFSSDAGATCLALCSVADVPDGGLRTFTTGAGRSVCVAREGASWFACEATCPHQGEPLCEAHLEDGVLTCLAHLWQWNLREGGVPLGRAERPLVMYPVRVTQGDVLLLDDRE